MKKVFTLVFIYILSSGTGYSQATFTWNASSTGNFTAGANWVGGVAPTATDAVLFDGTSIQNCQITTLVTVKGFTMASGYSGSIIASNIVYIDQGNFSQAGGTFTSSTTGSNYALTVESGNFIRTGGTFTTNLNGTVRFILRTTACSITGTTTFRGLRVESNGPPGERNLDFGTTTTATLVLAGGGETFSYQGSITTNTRLTVQGVSSGIPTANTGTITLAGGGTKTILSSINPGENILPNIVINGNVTAVFGEISVMGDWTHTSGNVNAGGTTVHMYGNGATISGAAITGTTVTFENLIIESGAVVTIPSGTTSIVLTGLLQVDGTVNNLSSAGVAFSGGTGSIDSPVTIGTVKVLPSSDLFLNAAVTIVDSLSLGASGTVDTNNGSLTFQANGTKSARIGMVGAGGSISGNVTVETFAPGPWTGWTNMGVTGIHNVTLGDWDGQIPMSCTGCQFGPNQVGTGWFKSVQGWDEPNCTYDTLLSAASTLTPGTGYWVYLGTGSVNTIPLTWSFIGAPVVGGYTIPITAAGSCTDAGFNLVSNPYASPISWDKVEALNSPGTGGIYIYNPDIPATTSYVFGFSSHANGANNVVPAGQAFYVDNFAFLTDLVFDESVKLPDNTSADPLLRSASNFDKNKNFFRLKINGFLEEYDETTFYLYPEATLGFDRKYDAYKFFQSPAYSGTGSYSNYTSISSKAANGTDLSVNGIPSLPYKVNIPVLVKVWASGTYTISANSFDNYSSCIVLKDKLNNSYIDLKKGPYIVSIDDTTSTPRFELIVCENGSAPADVAEMNAERWVKIGKDQQGAFVNTFFEKNTKATISVYNIIGQQLMNDVKVEGTQTTTYLNLPVHNQVVLIRVSTETETVVKKVVVE